MKNYLSILGGLATAASMFLPFVAFAGVSRSAFDAGGESYVWIGCGVAMIICGFMGKKPLNYVSLILGLATAGMAIKYKMDAGEFTGIGIWIMLAGGALAVIGSIMGLMKKT